MQISATYEFVALDVGSLQYEKGHAEEEGGRIAWEILPKFAENFLPLAVNFSSKLDAGIIEPSLSASWHTRADLPNHAGATESI